MRRKELIPGILVLIAFGIGAKLSPYFMDANYLLGVSSLYAEAGLLVLGMTLVIICGQIDLSVASMLALVACVVAELLAKGAPIPVAAIAGVTLGGVLGALNGLLIAKLRLPSFVVTLATMAIYRGIAQVMLGAESRRLPAGWVGVDYWKVPGTPLPVPLAVLIVTAVLMGVLLHRTVTGRWIFTTGSSERASLFAGVPTDRVKILVFTLSGVMAGLSALLIDSRLGVARFDHARGLEVDVIAAVVVGGTAIAGGSGSILGSMLALLLIALIRTGMGLANVSAEYQLAAVGTLLVLAVLTGNLTDRLPQPRTKVS